MSFYSQDNLRTVVDVSRKYLYEKYAYTVQDEKELKNVAYDVIEQLQKECDGLSLKQKNVLALSKIKEYYVNRYNLGRFESHSVKPIRIEEFAPSKYLEVDAELHEMLNSAKHDPLSLYRQAAPVEDIIEPIRKELTINPKTSQTRIISKYIGISSQDRMWWTGDYRYQYGVFLLQRHRNIDSISIGRVIIPDEIIQLSDPTKQSFNYDFTMAYPFLILKIDEFNDLYDGTNDTIRRGFCKLIFDKSYRGQNGRGYVVLKPEQHERKYFYPAPLGVLNKLSISLLKPNGALLNKSKDSLQVLNITYSNTKPNYYLITTNKYYDKNEFFPGDNVLIKSFLMTQLSLSQADKDIKLFNEFINNEEGHEVLETTSANGSGFYNGFYIQAIGTFNDSLGQFTADASLISCLNAYNSQSPGASGSLLNMSLQNSISMKLDLIVDDAKILDTQSVFNF